MKWLRVLVVLFVLGTSTVTYAASTAYNLTLTRKQQVALELRVKDLNEEAASQTPPGVAITPVALAQKILSEYLNGLAKQYLTKTAQEGVTLIPNEVVALAVMTGNIDLEVTGTGDVCNITLMNGAAPTSNFIIRNRCSVTKDTVNRLNVYFDIDTDRYVMQNKFTVSLTIKVTRAE